MVVTVKFLAGIGSAVRRSQEGLQFRTSAIGGNGQGRRSVENRRARKARLEEGTPQKLREDKRQEYEGGGKGEIRRGNSREKEDTRPGTARGAFLKKCWDLLSNF